MYKNISLSLSTTVYRSFRPIAERLGMSSDFFLIGIFLIRSWQASSSVDSAGFSSLGNFSKEGTSYISRYLLESTYLYVFLASSRADAN